MRAVVFHGPGKPLTVERLPDPKPAPHQVVVKVMRCGICGSDISMTEPGPFVFAYPDRMGHEYSGEVVEIGKDVTGLKVGDRITCMPVGGCGKCDICTKGNPNFCPAVRGLSQGWGEYAVMPAWNAIKTAADLSFSDSALVEPIACGLHALRRITWRGGERILILGTGAMAISIVYWARLMGAGKIVAISRYPHRNDVLLSMGVDAVMSTQDNDTAAFYEALGGLPDIVAECVGKPDMVAKAIQLTPPEKTMISLGMCIHAEPIVPCGLAFRDITMLFPFAYTYAEFIETVRAFESGSVRPGWIVSDVISLDEVPHVLEQLRAGTRRNFKIQVNPHA